MEIRRDFYLDKLIKRKNNGLIKVITGIRRCGKSYLLNNLFYHHLLESGVEADHIIRFAFDSADDLYLIGESLIQIEKEKRGVDPEKFMAYIRSKVVDTEMYYLLLDEIQMLDCFEAVSYTHLVGGLLDQILCHALCELHAVLVHHLDSLVEGQKALAGDAAVDLGCVFAGVLGKLLHVHNLFVIRFLGGCALCGGHLLGHDAVGLAVHLHLAAAPLVAGLTHRLCLRPVSYTHLDVYKRQAPWGLSVLAQVTSIFTGISISPGALSRQRSNHCLLYTSRCV